MERCSGTCSHPMAASGLSVHIRGLHLGLGSDTSSVFIASLTINKSGLSVLFRDTALQMKLSLGLMFGGGSPPVSAVYTLSVDLGYATMFSQPHDGGVKVRCQQQQAGSQLW